MPALVLTSAERSALRAQAHALHPVVMIGAEGLSPAVLKEAEAALRAHGLIKIRVFGDDRSARITMLDELCAQLDAAPIQHIGKLLVIWRPKPEIAVKVISKPGRATPRSSAPRAKPVQRSRQQDPKKIMPKGRSTPVQLGSYSKSNTRRTEDWEEGTARPRKAAGTGSQTPKHIGSRMNATFTTSGKRVNRGATGTAVQTTTRRAAPASGTRSGATTRTNRSTTARTGRRTSR